MQGRAGAPASPARKSREQPGARVTRFQPVPAAFRLVAPRQAASKAPLGQQTAWRGIGPSLPRSQRGDWPADFRTPAQARSATVSLRAQALERPPIRKTLL